MNKPLVLVVEDDRPVRSLIVTTLKSHDYRYLTAENGKNAIMEASSHNPDIVLLDLGHRRYGGNNEYPRVVQYADNCYQRTQRGFRQNHCA